MTVREIENIVRTLCSRHADLDESMLSILLRAGGWEDSLIRDALSIFARYQKTRSVLPVGKLLNPSQQENILPNVLSQNNTLISHSDSLSLKGVSEERGLPTLESRSLLPEIMHPDHMLEGRKVDMVNNTYEESLVLVKEVLRNKAVQPVIQGDAEVEVSPIKTVEQEQVKELAKTTAAAPPVDPSSSIPLKQDEEIVYLTQDGHIMEVETDMVVPEKEITNKENFSFLIKQEQTGATKVIEEKKGDIFILPTTLHPSTVDHISHPESLVVHDESRREQKQNPAIPENLPMRPFESSPHVVPFSKYKETFYKEEIAPVPAGEVEEKNDHSIPQPEHIELKKVPLSTGDEGIAILAGVMLLVIMLLLGYMYGNGRL
jgi:hypothetical protein